MNTCYIYVLIDPRTEAVRYVGRTAKVDQRLRLHKGKRSRNDTKDAWIAELQEVGLQPVMLIVEETDTDHWKGREMFWQEHFEKIGAELTSRNMRVMADALRNREDVREKYSKHLLKRWQDPAWREKMIAVHSGAMRPEGTGAKISAGKIEAHRKKREEAGGRVRLKKHTPEIVGLIDPEGNPVPPFRHIREFCEEHGLNPGHLGQVIKGIRHHHKGYTKI